MVHIAFTPRFGLRLGDMAKTFIHNKGKDELLRAGRLLAGRRTAEAKDAYNLAEYLGADADECSGGRWQLSMLEGDMVSAWREADAIRLRGRKDVHRLWDGSELSGKRIVVRCLHGYGDTVQMLRYIPQTLLISEKVILEVPPKLVPLITSLNFAADQKLKVITWGKSSPLERQLWDVEIEIMEFPYLFRTQTSDLPILSNYIRLPSNEITRVQAVMGETNQLRIGLVWSAGEWNPGRALPPELFSSLLRFPFDFWSLVDREKRQETDELRIGTSMKDANMAGEGIFPLSAVIANLDLVITTDTLAAHLAGAIGIPVWLMLPFIADWRWMHAADTSPWYPSMRIFRQSFPNEWSTVIDNVSSELQTRVLGCL